MKLFYNINISLWLFNAILILFFCVTIIPIEFKGVPISDLYSFTVTSLHFLTVCFCSAGLLMLLSANRWVFALFFPILFLFCAIICFYNITIGTRLTPVAIELALVNGASMWWTMISPLLIVVIILSLLIAFLIAFIRFKKVKTTRRSEIINAIISIFIILLPTCLIKRIHASVSSRLPYSIYYSFKEYINNCQEVSELRNTYDDIIVRNIDNQPDVIFIIGESLRVDHLPMNGYERNTMPFLMADSTLISFTKLYSPYTYTYTSVPHILTKYNEDDTDYAYKDQSFISVFKKGGYKTSWFANQELSKSYAYFGHEADTLYYVNANKSFYSYDKWLDTDIIPFFESWYQKQAHNSRFAVIHTIGSHWWYKSHYTDAQAVYKPEISHKDIGGLSSQEIINSYDNTIIATDAFLNDLLEVIRDENVIVIYVSDHGEALGEEGLYLHATETDVLHYPAMFVWYSKQYIENYPEIIEYLISIKDKRINTTSIFDLVMKISCLRVEPALKIES